MKNILQIFVIIIVISFNTAFAQKDFGIGIIAGDPTGLSAKLYTGSNNAFDFAAAWSFKGSGHLLLQADYVWHSSLSRTSSGMFALYYGIGGRIIFSNDPNVGVRIPIGIDYVFSTAPVDIFLEVVPVLDLIRSTDFDLNGGIGVRFWF
ncbi:MAG: hypothetical protein OQK52_01020 [Ignavibacteriaceae bacterium]|nr:hypothetical protein [Ignavibacteriaceae bacterium]